MKTKLFTSQEEKKSKFYVGQSAHVYFDNSNHDYVQA